MAKKRKFGSLTEMEQFFKQTGAEGGKARAAKLTKAELTEIGKKGAAARWAKKPEVAQARKRAAKAAKKGAK
jgi:general stress protein YciG